MDAYTATRLAEGFIDGTEDERIEAWQYLLDTGIVWQLQGSFGRQCAAMIEVGVLTPPPAHKPDMPDWEIEFNWETASGTGSSTIKACGYKTLAQAQSAVRRVIGQQEKWKGYALQNFGTCKRL